MENCLIADGDTPVNHQIVGSEICDIMTNNISNGNYHDHQQNEVSVENF